MTNRLTGIFVLDLETFDHIYGPNERKLIEKHVRWIAPPQTRQSIAEQPKLLKDVDVIFAGWGAPQFDDAFLDQTPQLKVIFYAAGAIAADAALRRGVVVTTAHHANSLPVAEYAFAAIVFSLKQAWHLARQAAKTRSHVHRNDVAGTYGSTVGLIGMGLIARQLVRMLRLLDVRIIVYDPFLTDMDAVGLGVESVSLECLFMESDVVSLHVPHLQSTTSLIRDRHLDSMKPGAAFVNTARGAVVNEVELLDVARRRPDLQFVLDVSIQEPPSADCQIYTLPNIFFTPHIAGSAGGECRRLGRYMVDELERFVAGQPLKWALTPAASTSKLPKAEPRVPQLFDAVRV